MDKRKPLSFLTARLPKKKTGGSGDNLPLKSHHDPNQDNLDDWKEEDAKPVLEELTFIYPSPQKPNEGQEVPVQKQCLNEEPGAPKRSVRVKSNMSIEGKEQKSSEPSLGLPTIISIATDYQKDYSKPPKYVTEFTIENPTSAYYGFKILCTKSGVEVYKATPFMGCIPPFQEVKVRLVVKPQESKSMHRLESIFVCGHPLDGPLDNVELEKFMMAMAVHWPKVGDRFELRPVLLEEELPGLLDTLEVGVVRKKLERKFVKDLKAQNKRLRALDYQQQINGIQCRIQKCLSYVSTLHIALNLTFFTAFACVALWFILDFFTNDAIVTAAMDKPEEIEPLGFEPEVGASDWTLWPWTVLEEMYSLVFD